MTPGQLEYLISSLPYLSFQQTKEVRDKVTRTFRQYAGVEAAEKDLIQLFEAEASKFLSSDAAKLLRTIDLAKIHRQEFRESNNSIIAGFAQYRYGLKIALIKQRLGDQKFREEWPMTEVPPLDLSDGNPLQKEIEILQLQWNKLEELASGHYFDLAALIIYKLKLMILQRWWAFDEPKGFRKFNQVIQEVDYGG